MARRTIICFFIALVLLANTAHASDNVLVIDYAIDKNDNITVNRIKAGPGDILIKETFSDEYRLEIRDRFNTLLRSINATVIFYIFGIGEVNESLVYFRIPMKDNYRFIEFIHSDEIIFEVDLSEYICNKNNICEPEIGESRELCFKDCKPPEVCGNSRCDTLENYGNCPTDCASGYPDGYCDRIEDGRCDLDCSKEEDIDCKMPYTAVVGESDEIPGYPVYYLILAIILAVLILFVLYRKIQEKKKWDKLERKYAEK